jgi:hypothetical protein
MTTNEELNHIQQLSISNPHRLKAKSVGLEVKPEPTYLMDTELDLDPTDLDSKPHELRTMEDWAEIIPQGTKSKVHFTVTMSSDTDIKFKEIMVYYQNRFSLGRVYKHYVLQMVINEVYEKMKKQKLL